MDLVKFDRYEVMELDKLVPADWNYKEDDEELSIKLANNLKRNGQVENIIVRLLDTGFYEVVNGNHRFGAMKTLGAKKIIVCNMGKMSAQDAQRLAIETNETRYKSDPLKLSTIIADLRTHVPLEDLVDTMPYSIKELDVMSNLSNFDWDQYKAGEGEGGGAGSDNAQDDSFVDLKFRVPEEVAELFNEQLDRIKKIVSRETNKEVVSEVKPLEIVACIIRDMSDKRLVEDIFGDDK